MKVRIGIDVGGTFTDAVAINNDTYELIGTVKVPTTHTAKEGVAAGIVEVLHKVMEENGIRPEDVTFIAHGTTQATNALLEGDVANVGIVTMGSGLQGAKSRSDTAMGSIELAAGKFLPSENVYVDTGAMYRSIGLYAVRAGVDPKDEAAVTALLPQIKLAIRLVDGAQHIYLNGEDVSDAIRAENIGMAASAVSAHPPVRAFLLDTQRGLAADQNILMDGRDIGTVVLPNATVKIFLTASAEARAERRRKELEEKGQPADFATVLADIRQRDYQDTHRAIAPLKQADDAILVDTSDIGFDESFELLKRTILAHI